MTAKNQDFVVKHGLQVSSNIVVGAYTGTPSSRQINNGAIISGNVGIGTSNVIVGTRLQVTGGNVRISSPDMGLIFADGTRQITAATNTPSYGYQYTLQFAGAANTFSGDSTNLTWDNANVALQTSNAIITSTTPATSLGTGALQVIGGASINGNLYIGGDFNVGGTVNFSNVGGIQNLVVTSLVSNTYIHAATVIQGNNIVANVNIGIGTTTALYPLDVYGNIHLSNTATSSGIIFPDGTYQHTAATGTPSFGDIGTVQVAGAGNTYTGNTDNFYWDNSLLKLNVNKLKVSNTATVNVLVSNIYGAFGQNVSINGSDISVTTTSGALTVVGGVGIEGNINIGGSVNYFTGNVGIGSATPIGKLSVYSDTRTSPNSTILSITSPYSPAGPSVPTYGMFLQVGSHDNATDAYGMYSELSAISDGGSTNSYSGFFKHPGSTYGTSYGTYVENRQLNTAGTGIAYGSYIKILDTTWGTGNNGGSYGLKIDSLTSSGIVYGLDISTVAGSATVYPINITHAGSIRLRMDATGNVGIGSAVSITGPLYAQRIISNTSVSATSIRIADLATINTLVTNSYSVFGQNITVNSTNASISTTTGALRVLGGAGINGNVYAGGNVVAASFQPIGNSVPPNGMYLASTDKVAFSTANTERMIIDSNGNVGIGTSTVDAGYILQINGEMAATIKSFVIKHPTRPNYKLRYASLEGPENGIYVRGSLTNCNVVELPHYWAALIDEHSITVNLTANGTRQNLWVEHISNTAIKIGSDTANISCFYTIYAERKDVNKLLVEYKNTT